MKRTESVKTEQKEREEMARSEEQGKVMGEAERSEGAARGTATEIVFILDRSGSMGGLEADTIGGYNGLIEKQKQEEGKAFVTTILFDDRVETLCDRIPLEEVRPMTRKDYYVRGCTALLDAVGETIERITTIHRYARPEDRPEKTLFIITTDGLENASRRYSYEDVRRLVERRRGEDHWEFLFLGANIDAAAEAGRFGIREDRAVRYHNDSAGTQLNYQVLGRAVSAARCSRSSEEMEAMLDADDLMAPIREDYRKRKKK